MGAQRYRLVGLLLLILIALAMAIAIAILRPYQFASTDVAAFYRLEGVAEKVAVAIVVCSLSSAVLAVPIMLGGKRNDGGDGLDTVRRLMFGVAVVLLVFSLGDFLLAQIVFFTTSSPGLPPGTAVGQQNWLFRVEWISIVVTLTVGVVLSVVIAVKSRLSARR